VQVSGEIEDFRRATVPGRFFPLCAFPRFRSDLQGATPQDIYLLSEPILSCSQ